jgi:hypothetical protein
MRGVTILLAIALTLGYGFAAQAAITADRAETIRRVGGFPDVSVPSAEEAATRVWYGGMLPPVTVEVTRATPATGRCLLS